MNVSAQEKQLIRDIYGEIRKELDGFCIERDFQLSNPQVFTLLGYAPNALAIALDGTVDIQEIGMLEQISKTISVDSMVSIDLLELMSVAPEPENCISNEEFNIRIGTELLYLSRNMDKYKASMIKALQALLKFDPNPKAEVSMTKTFASMMNSVVEKNLSRNKEEELEKLKKLQQEIGV